MDVLVLEPLRARSMTGSPGDSTIEQPRRRRFWPFGRPSGTAPGGSAGGATVARRNGLYTYTAASIVLGLGVLAWTSVVNEPLPAIDPHLPPGTVLSGPTGGLLLWLVYGLLGSLRVLRAPGGASMTFHLPFIGAAMVLGGPTAGAWVAFLSSIERRELESQPWYGILANHATLVSGRWERDSAWHSGWSAAARRSSPARSWARTGTGRPRSRRRSWGPSCWRA